MDQGFDTALNSGQLDPYFLGFNNDQKNGIRQSLDDWGDACNIDFIEIDETSSGSYGDVRFFGLTFAFEGLPWCRRAAGLAYYPYVMI